MGCVLLILLSQLQAAIPLVRLYVLKFDLLFHIFFPYDLCF